MWATLVENPPTKLQMLCPSTRENARVLKKICNPTELQPHLFAVKRKEDKWIEKSLHQSKILKRKKRKSFAKDQFPSIPPTKFLFPILRPIFWQWIFESWWISNISICQYHVGFPLHLCACDASQKNPHGPISRGSAFGQASKLLAGNGLGSGIKPRLHLCNNDVTGRETSWIKGFKRIFPMTSKFFLQVISPLQ